MNSRSWLSEEVKMNAYEILCNTNRAIIKGQTIPDDEKQGIVQSLLSGASAPVTVRRFLAGVKATEENRSQYPQFYIPPYNGGKKYRLITGQMPKTQILSANHYELEILRLLALWGSGNERVRQMTDQTLKRLDAACFGHFLPGERVRWRKRGCLAFFQRRQTRG
jgi:hypothetical protein